MAEALKTRQANEQQEIDDEAAVVDVRIDRLFGSHNVYEFDRKHGALRLARFVTGDGPWWNSVRREASRCQQQARWRQGRPEAYAAP